MKIPNIFEIVELQAALAVHVDMDVVEKDGEKNPVSPPELLDYQPFHRFTRKKENYSLPS